MSVLMRLLQTAAGQHPALADRRPWEPGEPVTVLSCNPRTGRPVPRGRPVMFFGLVEACDRKLVTVVIGFEGRKPAYEAFWAETGWDAHPSLETPWRLFHGWLRRE